MDAGLRQVQNAERRKPVAKRTDTLQVKQRVVDADPEEADLEYYMQMDVTVSFSFSFSLRLSLRGNVIARAR